jgi:hypothetical protein
LLYPNKPKMSAETGVNFRVPFLVRDPFGADQVLAITSTAPLDSLAAAVRELDKRRSAGRIYDVVRRLLPPDARVGLVGLFTVP